MSIVNLSDHKRIVSHELCKSCVKNGVSCLESDDACLPIEMFVQLSKETRILKKLEYVDNVASYLDLENSY